MLDFLKKEERILKFWEEKHIFEKSLKKRKGRPSFVFYEGPPTANAKAGIHHVLARVFKDIICRYKTMQGFRVERKAGWDTHGLPVELEIEKKLGFKNKKDIEKYGIAKFNELCRQSVWEYKKDWEDLTERIGFWLDLKNPYITYTPEYMETVWFLLKKIWEKGLLCEDLKVVPYCPRCQTSLSSHEVAMGYKKIKEPAIYIKFQILNPKFKIQNKSKIQNSKFKTYLLVWTTTPWTLPGNVAIAINENFVYCKLKTQKLAPYRNGVSGAGSKLKTEYLILAKERIEACGIKGEIVEEFKGKELVGWEYEPLFNLKSQIANRKFTSQKSNLYQVLAGDFVSLEEGTGLVHIAPAFGEEDMEMIKTQNSKLKAQNLPEFPILLNVDEEGRFTKEVEQWAGRLVTDDSLNEEIIEGLKRRNLLFKKETCEHDYPLCWRCNSKLIYYAKKSWFIKMKAVKEKLLKNNQQINWIPSHLKEGRFGEWLREIKDWALSRERFWGTPLPVWHCQTGKSQISNLKSQTPKENKFPTGQANQKFKIQNSKKCSNIVVIGSRGDLLKKKFSTNQYYILRHGETIHQSEKKDVVYPFPEKEPIGLTKKGEKEVKKVAKKLKKEKIDPVRNMSRRLLRLGKNINPVRNQRFLNGVNNSCGWVSCPARPVREIFSNGARVSNGVDLIFSSDITRCKQTAEVVAKELGLNMKLDKRLRDVNLGVYHGRKKEEFYRNFPRAEERFYKRPSGGENWSDCKKRMLNFLKEIDKKYQKKKILIISHGDPLWLLEGAMKGLKNEEYFEAGKKIIPKTGELRKLDFKIFPFNEVGELDFHRPFVDEVKFYCQKCPSSRAKLTTGLPRSELRSTSGCGNLMERVPEVIDCWFDSGAMPFAQGNFPFAPASAKTSAGKQNQKYSPPKLFPADYITEGVDQTRGWFYTLLAISTLLGFGVPYKNVISLGLVLDKRGEKMSKSKGNVVDPAKMIEKYGADALRWYFFTINPLGEPKRFDENDIKKSLNRFLRPFWNSFLFWKTYASKSQRSKVPPSPRLRRASKSQKDFHNLLDKWVISRLENLIQFVKSSLDSFDIVSAAREIEKFTLEDLSNWYIRRSRQRFQWPKSKKDLSEASKTLGFILFELSKLCAPFVPFLSEEIYRQIAKKGSVHLEYFPEVKKGLISKKLEKEMEKVKELISLALNERKRLKIKVRQPLRSLEIQNLGFEIPRILSNLIKEEVNVKEVRQKKGRGEIKIFLETKITPKLRKEGILREIVHQIQELRKRAKLTKEEKIEIYFQTQSKEIEKNIKENAAFIKKRTVAIGVRRLKKLGWLKLFDQEVRVNEEKVWIGIKRSKGHWYRYKF